MRAFPRDLLERLPMLQWESFSSTHPMAQALAALPPSKGVNRYHAGRTPLGWVCFGSFPSMLVRGDRIAWIDFLLAHGADPTLPLAKPSAQSMSERHLGPALLSQATLASKNQALLEVATRHGLKLIAQPPPTAPLSHRMDFSAIAAWENPEWVLDYARLAHPWERNELLGRVLDAWKLKPGLCLEGVNALRGMGMEWDPADAPNLWFLALTDESPAHFQWLGWAKSLGLGGVHGPNGIQILKFQTLIGRALLHHSPSVHNLTNVRKHLQVVVPPACRSLLAPQLPDVDRDFPLRPSQWVGASRMIQWAIDWGAPTASRTLGGIPWSLWVLQNAHLSCDSIMGHDNKQACEGVAWECLQALVRAGHRPSLRVKSKGGGYDFLERTGSSFSEGLRRYFVLSSHLSDWPERFERLKREMAFEKRLNKKLEKEGGKALPLIPKSRF